VLLLTVAWRCVLQDNSQMGIKATLSRLNAALKAHDRELWCHLEVKNQVCPNCSNWLENSRAYCSQLTTIY
jgi:hypothetical protein